MATGESRGRVLVVEDDEALRSALALALNRAGYDVVAAWDGAAALEYLWDRMDAAVADGRDPDQPDLIVLDLYMAGMDGQTFARLYEQKPGPRAPIVVVSSDPDARLIARRMRGVMAILNKPFDMAALVDLVDRHLRRRAA